MFSNSSLNESPRLQRAVGQWFMTIAVFLALVPVQVTRADEMLKDQATSGSVSVASTKVVDPGLLDWIGKWDGVSKNGKDTSYMELEWKLSDNSQWIVGKIKFWADSKKKTLLGEESVFIRPSDNNGMYKGFVFGEGGVMRTGRAEVKDRVWEWTWDYDNGMQEKSKMVYFSQGKIFYDGILLDNNGQQLRVIDYDLTRPVVLSVGSRR